MRIRIETLALFTALIAPGICAADGASFKTFAENGGWCWFQDERAIVDNGTLIFGAVAGRSGDGHQGGDIYVTAYDFAADSIRQFELHDRLDQDDHAVPALIRLNDGRFLAMYSTHGRDPFSRWRATRRPRAIDDWTTEQTFTHDSGNPTYSNLFFLGHARGGAGRLYNFTRGRGWDPNWMISDDNGRTWQYAGTGLYPREADYTGLAAIDPNATDTVFISADVHPATGLPNVSKADGKRHYEIFKGRTPDGGGSWEWTPLTQDSTLDNLRPIAPISSQKRVVLWMRGAYTAYTDYDTDIVGIVNDR